MNCSVFSGVECLIFWDHIFGGTTKNVSLGVNGYNFVLQNCGISVGDKDSLYLCFVYSK